MADIEITVDAGASKRLLTAGKYCDKNILVTATEGGESTSMADGLFVPLDLFWKTGLFSPVDFRECVMVSCVMFAPLLLRYEKIKLDIYNRNSTEFIPDEADKTIVKNMISYVTYISSTVSKPSELDTQAYSDIYDAMRTFSNIVGLTIVSTGDEDSIEERLLSIYDGEDLMAQVSTIK